MATIILKPDRDKSVRHRHPWIFSSAVMSTEGDIYPGVDVTILDSKKNFIARGYYNPKSSIRARVLEWSEAAVIDEAWWKNRLSLSISRRLNSPDYKASDAHRLVYGESDLIPGLIVDQYKNYLVIQALTAGIDRKKKMIAGLLNELLHPEGIYERSDADVRRLEGLESSNGLLFGQQPEDSLVVTENGLQYSISIKEGQKTGFFMDQRDNRQLTGSYAKGKDVLDCFCYSGGFSLSALKAGANSVLAVDSSAAALNSLTENIELNHLDKTKIQLVEADVFQLLRKYRDDGASFDMIILDPPKLAPTKTHLEKAIRAYKDINLLALKLLRPEGVLVTFSCSGGVTGEDFRRMVGWAAKDAGRELQIEHILSQSPDHPVRMSYPESEYLKGLICRVL